MKNEEIQELLKHSFETLVEDVTRGTSERLVHYLAFSAKFHQYSPDNQMLIFEQCPEATRVAGYKKWQEEGYQVAKGAKGIRIKAPRLKRDPDDEEKKIVVGYIDVSVFDASQLTERPPTLFPEIYGDYDRLYQRVIHAIQRNNIRVMETNHTFGAHGYSAQGTLAVREDIPVGNRCLILLHEWAHEIIHDAQKRQELHRTVKECHAEATAFVVATHYGVPTPYSSDYLLHWGNTPETLKSEMEIVLGSASQIITVIDTAFDTE